MTAEHLQAIPKGAVAVASVYPNGRTAEIVVRNVAHYAKVLVYIALAAVGVLVAGLNAGQDRPTIIVNTAVAALGAVLVYAVPNLPGIVGQYLKVIVAFVVAALQGLLPFWISGHIGYVEWLQVGIAAFAAIGVYVTPNGAATEMRVVPYEPGVPITDAEPTPATA
jgi:hypothetical protein